MLTTRGDERQPRKPKPENRFYNFLTRSRSRSRSKNEELLTEEPNVQLMPELPQKTRSHTPGSKPVSRIQSRPLSSTTTATNTTITPSTPKAKKRPQPHVSTIPPAPIIFDNSQSSSSNLTTPKPSATRQKLHDLFRIPLGRKSSSRSRSRSRPSSPQMSSDIPPLPTPDDITPKQRRSSPPRAHRISRPRSPSPTTPRLLRVTNATPSLASTAPSLKIPKFFSSRNASTIDHSRTAESNFGGPSIIPPMVSAPLKRVSSLHRHSLKPVKVDGLQTSNLIQPQIIHTPASPLKTTDAKGATTAGRLGYHALKNSLDSGYRYRGATMGVLDEEGRIELDTKSNTKGKTMEPEPVARPAMKMSSAVRSRKHGSFDFERPGWGATQIQRSGSNGTTGTTTSEWSKNTDSIHKERDSTCGPGLAGVGTLQREASMKRAQDGEDKMRLRDLGRKQTVAADKEITYHPPNTSSAKATLHTSSTPSDHLHTSTSTTGKSNVGTEKSIPNTGKSSSMSKAGGKRALHATKTASGSGVARFIGLRTQHGPFSFEPPVPSPTRSTGSNGTSHEIQVSWAKTEKERVRLRDEKERQQLKDKKNVQRGDRPPVPVPMPSTNVGHRSGTKGRSLDLGLGLAWAPSRVREEALLPSSTFFARSLSNSSSVGTRSTATQRSGSSSTTGNGNGRSKGRMVNGSLDPDVQRSKLGKEVAELFRHAVDPEGYAAFKTYVHQFDAHEIPFDGPTGIVARVERLLASAPGLGDEAKQRLLDKFIRIILQQA
ncbi:hypothetical protein BYT27DRAFT_7239825, partial [Phlegmacium glaucopus]